MLKILVTGANGFIGSAFCREALSRGMHVSGATRKPCNLPIGIRSFVVGNIDSSTDWRNSLVGCDILTHLAARVHEMSDTAVDPLTEFRRVNVQGTLNLARQAVSAGVRRFVFVSSIKVNGEETQNGQPFTTDDLPAQLDAYGLSKLEAEQGLREIAMQTSMEIVIIRPPLVYGPGVKGNFATMMRWLQRGVHFPLGAIHNKRSLVALDNLVDLIITCLTHPAAANKTFMVSDGEDVSTTELLRRMGQAMGHPVSLISVPVGLIKLGATLVGKRELALRLCGSLQVDISQTQKLLGWAPSVSLDEGLRRTAAGLGLQRLACHN